MAAEWPSSNLEAVEYEKSDIWTDLSHNVSKGDVLQLPG